MADNRNFAALDWLIHEISETLKEARQSLESYVENPKDAARIRFCLTHIHQVHGSLQMVEFYGAAMLASEMEQLTQAMIAGRVANASEAQEVLMRAILQFPLYLDQVKATRKDNPLIVLPLLNDLRAVRGESLLTDTKLFVPNLTPAKKVSGARLPVTHDNVQFQAMVLKLRQMYQYAASGFIRGVNPDENLAYLQKAFSRLQKLTHGTARYALWDVCLALVEAIEIDAIEISVAVKNLLRQLDKEIKLLAVHGIKALNSFTNDELIKNLLYYVARAGKHVSTFPPHSHLQRIYETYHLEEALLEGKDTGDESQDMLSMPDADAMRSVVGALKEELNLIKNSLDVCLAGGDTHATLGDALPIVKRVADTMAVLGLGDLRKRILEQGAALELVVESNSQLNDEQLLAIASQIISVENALDSLTEAGGQDSRQSDESDITLTRAKESVLRESRNGLEHAKDAIIEYIASQWNRQHLQSVPTTLREIRGGLEIMPLPRPARILGACARFIEEQLLEHEATPQWTTLDTLADAITSVEYYLERLSSGGRKEENDLLLSVAEESVASLGYAVAKISKSDLPVAEPIVEPVRETGVSDEEAELAAAYDTRAYAEPEAQDESSQLEAIYANVVPEEASTARTETAPASVLQAPEIVENADEALIGDEEESDEDEPSISEPTLIPTNIAPVIQRTNNEDIDEEIIEIFIEEASEVTETIGEYFPRWAEDFEDNESLIEFRRAFHTLKGSGRMVGANDIGELAWSIENMLNRVIDHTIVPQVVHAHIIEKVRGLLPGMIAAFRDNQPNPQAELAETYRQQAHSLSQGVIPDELLAGLDGTPTTQAATTPLVVEEEDTEELVDIEDSLVEDSLAESLDKLEEVALGEASDNDQSYDQSYEESAEDEQIDDVIEAEIDQPEIIIEDVYAGVEPADDEILTLEEEVVAAVPVNDSDIELLEEDTSAEELALEQAYAEQQQPIATHYIDRVNEDIDIDDPDAQLWDIFGAEAVYHLHVVQQFIQRMEAEAPIYEPPSEDMQRALHTLKGSAHMAEVTPVAELATPLERFVKELRSYHVNINDDILQLLRDAVSYTQIALRQIESGTTVEIPRLQQFIARVHELRDIHVTPLVSLQETDEMGKRPVDPELLAIFMAEEMNLLLDADKIISQWQANPTDTAQLVPVMDELDKLTQAAAHAYLPTMAELGSKIHNVYEAIIAGQLRCSPQICETLNKAHTALLDKVDAIAAGQNLSSIPEAINDSLDELLSNEVVMITSLAIDHPPVINEEIPLVEQVEEEIEPSNTEFDAEPLPTAEVEDAYTLELEDTYDSDDEVIELDVTPADTTPNLEADEEEIIDLSGEPVLVDSVVELDEIIELSELPDAETEFTFIGDTAELAEPAEIVSYAANEDEDIPILGDDSILIDEALEPDDTHTPMIVDVDDELVASTAFDDIAFGEAIELADTIAPDETLELDEPAPLGDVVELIDEDAYILN
ncbi:MAG TPA: Hpt domain-containing protein, partial [Cellvibrio sp.]|nr:Hpt domain-containing protein [Cellvibrio sp.]